MSITAFDYKKQANEYYSKQQWSLAIDGYSKAIESIRTKSDESVPLYLLYLNRSSAYIQDKNFFDGYQDARQSLKLKVENNSKSSYCAGICAYHLGFIDKAMKYAEQAINNQQEKFRDYFDLKLLIEKKVNVMKRWRKTDMTATKCLDKLHQIIHQNLPIIELPSLLYQIRYLLRASFDNQSDKKLMNIATDILGIRLRDSAKCFTTNINIERMIKRDPVFEDMILHELPDVGRLRLKAYKQKRLPLKKQNHKLIEQAEEDLAAFEFSFFVNNILALLAVEATDTKIRLRALKQIHRLITNDLYRQAVDDSLSMSIHNYIYFRSKNSTLINEFLLNGGIEILFYDCMNSIFQKSIIEIIQRITTNQWRSQSKLTIQFILKQISDIIDDQGIELLNFEQTSKVEFQLHELFGSSIKICNSNDYLNLIINVLTKIFYIFGKEPFIQRLAIDPFYLFNYQTWLNEFPFEQHRTNIPLLIQNWFENLKDWLNITAN